MRYGQETGAACSRRAFSEYIPLIAIILLATALRLDRLAEKSLWTDEIHRIVWSRNGFSWLLQNRLRDLLNYTVIYITDLWAPAINPQEFGFRLPAATIGLCGVSLAYVLGRRIFNQQVGVLSAFLLAISPLHLHYSQDASQYTLMYLLSMLTVYLLWRALEERHLKWWLAFALASVANLYNHVYTVFLLLAETVALAIALALRARRTAPAAEQDGPQGKLKALFGAVELQKPLLSYALIAVLWAPAALWTLKDKLVQAGVAHLAATIGSLSQRFVWLAVGVLLALAAVVALSFWLFRRSAWPGMRRSLRLRVAAAPLAALILCGLYLLRLHGPLMELLFQPFFGGRGPILPLFLVFFVVGTVFSLWDGKRAFFLLVYALALVSAYVFHIRLVYRLVDNFRFDQWPDSYRYVSFVFPLGLILGANGMVALAEMVAMPLRRAGKVRLVAEAAFLVLSGGLVGALSVRPLQDYYSKLPLQDWRGAAAFLRSQVQQGQDLVFAFPSRVVAYHYGGPVISVDYTLRKYLEDADKSERAWLLYTRGVPWSLDAKQLLEAEREMEARNYIILRWSGPLNIVLKDSSIRNAEDLRARKEQLLREAMAFKPNNPPFYVALAEVRLAAGDVASAFENYRIGQALGASGISVFKYWELGRLAEAQGDLRLAARIYEQALQVAPKGQMAGTYFRLGGVYWKLGEHGVAVEHYRKAISYDPGLLQAYVNIAKIREAQGDAAAALAEYERAVAALPNDASAHAYLGDALKAAGDKARALQEYEKAALLKPEAATYQVKIGQIYEEQNALATAEAYYRKAVALEGDQGSGIFLLAQVLEKQGRLAEALPIYARAADAQPTVPLRQFKAGQAYEAAGDLEAALAYYQRAVKLRPEIIAYRARLAEVYRLLGRVAESIAQYEQLVQLDPKTAVRHYELALLYREAGEQEKMVAALQAYLELAPNGKYAAQARELIAGAAARSGQRNP